jgi:hypothetical protein
VARKALNRPLRRCSARADTQYVLSVCYIYETLDDLASEPSESDMAHKAHRFAPRKTIDSIGSLRPLLASRLSLSVRARSHRTFLTKRWCRPRRSWLPGWLRALVEFDFDKVTAT